MKSMKNFLHVAWRWVRWPVLVLGFLYAVLVGFRTFVLFDEEKTAEAVAQIHAQKITLADVMGASLPPTSDKAENDSTVVGIDKNNNGIRDDVELAIFKKYPNSAKIRAAELQYALTEQMFLTRVVNTETWKAVAEENGRASSCVAAIYPRKDLGLLTETELNAYLKSGLPEYVKKVENLVAEVENLVFNTNIRKDARQKSFEYITTNGDAPGPYCDVDI